MSSLSARRALRSLTVLAVAGALAAGTAACSSDSGDKAAKPGGREGAAEAGQTPSDAPTAADPNTSVPPPLVPDALVRKSANGGRTVALTFDDGPSPQWTPQVLALLKEYRAKATFCMLGPNAKANPKLVKQVVADGNRLCDHSVTHDEGIAKRPLSRIKYEITTAHDQIVAAGGPGTRVDWFRAPGGDWSPQVRAMAAGYGMRSLDWSDDTRDWQRPGADKILATAERELKPGGIILMHDAGGDRAQTLTALKQLLPWLVQQGYTFDFPA
ncbi:polysaccharide deacetylase family protein [Embleya sp. NBC_00888]|uniref:polysaccharide deacetylase family protein n=1 Tax=Embleya sp. NBC_00888 TaxID=2975960 RepID=UPI003868E74C|nr:polysaccharide deacetylase family protein [Embleya sp. NBC_00888]